MSFFKDLKEDYLDSRDTSTESQYIASRYDGLPNGPTMSYTFEAQEGIPYDGSNKQARTLSPFTIRLVVPSALERFINANGGSVDVNLVGRAGQESDEMTDMANQIREAVGIPSVSNTNNLDQQLIDLKSVLSAGQALSTTLGETERAVLTDLTTVADIRYQLELILQTPPLTLFINPNSFSISYTTVQQFSNRSRHGKLFERWGEGQPVISISGSTGGFVAGANPNTAFGTNTSTKSPSGVQFASKRDSAAFQQLMSLYQIYRNNGLIYDTTGGTEAHLMIGSVAIDYDQMTYVGNINSFEYTYSDEMPNRIEWSMEFQVGRMYDSAEEPIVVLPQSSPTPGVGQLSTSEILRTLSDTPSKSDVTRVGGDWFNVTGNEQFEVDRKNGETPLDVIGAYFTPTGLLG